MRKFTFLFIGLMAVFAINAQTIDLGIGIQHADITAADVDGDGDLDIVASGDDGGVKKAGYFINNGDGTFPDSTFSFVPVSFTSFDWGDYDGDGDLDLIQNGWGQAAPFAGIYKNDDGYGFFMLDTITMEQYAISAGWADLNNDAKLDFYLFSNGFEADPAANCNIYFNEGEGVYTAVSPFDAFRWVDPDVTAVDYDNDGDIDLFVNGWDDRAGYKSRYSKIFSNNAGSFTEVDLGLIQKGFGSATWGDYDADGDLDLLLNGDGGADGEASSDIYRLYKNNGAAFLEAATFNDYRQISPGDGGRLADWDNDGDLDVFLSGWSNTDGNQVTKIFANSAGVFTELTSEDIPGVSESSIEVADLDNDLDLDLMITGYCGDSARNVTLIYTNATVAANTAPTAPTTLTTSSTGSDVTISWGDGADTETATAGLSYNYYLKDTDSGKWLVFPNSNPSTGYRMVSGLGNAYQNKQWTLMGLPDGNYAWSVQAIDASFVGSVFATEETFSIPATAVNSMNEQLQIKVYPNPVKDGNIYLSKAGVKISSIKLSGIEGRTVKEFDPDKEVLNVSDVSNGVYILTVKSENKVTAYKIVIR